MSTGDRVSGTGGRPTTGPLDSARPREDIKGLVGDGSRFDSGGVDTDTHLFRSDPHVTPSHPASVPGDVPRRDGDRESARGSDPR